MRRREPAFAPRRGCERVASALVAAAVLSGGDALGGRPAPLTGPAPDPAPAQRPAPGLEEPSRADAAARLATDLDLALKATLLAPEEDPATSLWRARLVLAAWLDAPELRGELAYEQRMRLEPAGEGTAGEVLLPSEVPAPFRIRQLDAVIADEPPRYSYRHELDRAFLRARAGALEATVGRQAMGLGRGVIFSGVDVLAPFSLLEIDREWRRGVDAARLELKVSDHASVDVVGAAGESWDESVLLGRARGYLGEVDGEIVLGKRAADGMLGATASALVGGAEIHGELVVFDTPDAFGPRLFGRRDLVPKALAGGSYTVDVGSGLTLWAEYLYSGFGGNDMRDIVRRFAQPAYVARLARGDLQTLGRHAGALRAAYAPTDTASVSATWLASLSDGSGVLAPSLVWTLSDQASVTVAAFVPYGAGPDALGIPRSEYGGATAAGFLQLALYESLL